MAELPEISYPTLVWREGYIYLARTALELCTHPRSIFGETIQRTKSCEMQLVDSEGRRFDIVDWKRVRPFGGVKGIPYRLLFSVFAVPVLANETRLSLSEYKKTLARAVRSRYRYEADKAQAVLTIKYLKAADSFEAAIAALPRP